jgi:hypothetical protein
MSSFRMGLVALVSSMAVACNPSAAAKLDARGDAARGDGAAAIADAGDARAALARLLDAGPPDDAIPPTSSDELTVRAKHLLEAIAKDDPTLAADIVFPREGFLAMRDVSDPGKEWEKRVGTPFEKSLHRAAKRTKGGDRVHFVSLELGHAVVQTTPKRHGWKKPLWNVKHSRLTYIVDGKSRTITIGEMTAWRGAWYVTRLR